MAWKCSFFSIDTRDMSADGLAGYTGGVRRGVQCFEQVLSAQC